VASGGLLGRLAGFEAVCLVDKLMMRLSA